MNSHTIHPNDCGNCKHFKLWDFSRECEYWANNPYEKSPHTKDDLHFGDCNRIQKGTKFGDNGEFEYSGYSFEDECYDEEFHCFEPVKEEMK